MVTVVTGPPCSGKSTYVRQRARRGDVVIDLDRIALALTSEDTPHHEYDETIRALAIRVRETAVRAILGAAGQVTAWIVDSDPSPERRRQYRIAGAELIALDPGIDVCLARASAERPAWVADLIRSHYAA